MIRKIIVANIILTLASLTGCLLCINAYLLYASNHNNQSDGFSRRLLQYFDPIARWGYPDIGTKRNSDKRTTFIVGDSYAEGAGDGFLSNAYDYSVGHFIHKKEAISLDLAMAANSGSDIPKQLDMLNLKLQGQLEPLSFRINNNSSINLLLFFYEGNDLENVTRSKRKLSDSNFEVVTRKYFPILYAAQKLWRERSESTNDQAQTITISNRICVRSSCRDVPPLQSASVGMTRSQITNAIGYTISEIKAFRQKHPRGESCFVYVPSPATIYSPNKFYFQNYFGNSAVSSTSTINSANSQFIRSEIQEKLTKDGVKFVDPTRRFQDLGRLGYVHGYRDPNHFSIEGYRTLAHIVASECKL